MHGLAARADERPGEFEIHGGERMKPGAGWSAAALRGRQRFSTSAGGIVTAARVLLGCLIAAVVALAVTAAPAAAIPSVTSEKVEDMLVCRETTGVCSPGVVLVGSPVSVAPFRTELRNYGCPTSYPYPVWQMVVPELSTATISYNANVTGFHRLTRNMQFTAWVHNWVGPSEFRYRMYWACRRDLLLDPDDLRVRLSDTAFMHVINELDQLFTDENHPNTELFKLHLARLFFQVNNINVRLPDIPNPRGVSAAGALAAGGSPSRRNVVRLRAGENLLGVVYPHTKRISRPPAAVLRLSGHGRACRANRLMSTAAGGRALIAVRLDCPRSAAGARAELQARPTVRRSFALRDGRLPLRLSVPVPRGDVSAYAVIEGPRGTPCRVAPVKTTRNARSVEIRTTATCRGVRPGTRGVAWIGGLIDGSERDGASR
jgi:hypothetical protein